MERAKIHVSILSSANSVLIIIIMIIYLVLMNVKAPNSLTFAAIFQYITCALIFIKLYLIYLDLPSQYFCISNNDYYQTEDEGEVHELRLTNMI